MDAPAGQQWFLRKHEDGSTFGPLTSEQLAVWASSAQVAPNDSISSDETNWMKAPMLPDLGMDWIVEVTSERYYGPTTLGAVNEFIRLGEIHGETFVLNACDGTRHQIKDIGVLLQSAPVPSEVADNLSMTMAAATEPTAMGIAVGVQERIRELEEALREERRALAEAEQRYRQLEAKYLEAVSSIPAR